MPRKGVLADVTLPGGLGHVSGKQPEQKVYAVTLRLHGVTIHVGVQQLPPELEIPPVQKTWQSQGSFAMARDSPKNTKVSDANLSSNFFMAYAG